MPSLKVSKSANKNTHAYFYASLTKLGHDNTLSISISDLISNVVKIAISTMILSSFMYIITIGWAVILFFYYYTVYEKYRLYYLCNEINYVICHFLSSLFINHIFMNGYCDYSLKHNCISAFVVAILINGTINTFLYWQHS